MSWKNYGTYWQIDHIIPQTYFEFDSLDHPNFVKCWCLENLRPLKADENLSKSNKLDKKIIKKHKISELLA